MKTKKKWYAVIVLWMIGIVSLPLRQGGTDDDDASFFCTDRTTIEAPPHMARPNFGTSRFNGHARIHNDDDSVQ